MTHLGRLGFLILRVTTEMEMDVGIRTRILMMMPMDLTMLMTTVQQLQGLLLSEPQVVLILTPMVGQILTMIVQTKQEIPLLVAKMPA